MQLSKSSIAVLDPKKVEVPAPSCFELPEKVLQFGTGVLLRGLPDYFIDKANKKGIFNGRIVMVKSTTQGDMHGLQSQDCLYTQCVRGLQQGANFEENIINASVSRILAATIQWEAVLDCAANPELSVIISNTTEIGIAMPAGDEGHHPPASFPGKLLAFLHRRYEVFKGDPARGLVIIPTELLPDNGKLLQEILVAMSLRLQLGDHFIQWLTKSNIFCNSLVDRIVPGALPVHEKAAVESALGYQDECMIMSEPYRLWAIESSSPKIHDVLSFSSADPGVAIAPDIRKFLELKLRLLNGPHTLGCGLAHMSGFSTVREAMSDRDFLDFLKGLMQTEIIPSITNKELGVQEANDFARNVLERFANPYLNHAWLNITLQYSSKMKMRNVPLILSYFDRFGKPPAHMALGFAAHILFMRPSKFEDGKYWGESDRRDYAINDDNAGLYAALWENAGFEGITEAILRENRLWGADLSLLPGFSAVVHHHLEELRNEGARVALKRLSGSGQVIPGATI
jgi:tagaturonate reductase